MQTNCFNRRVLDSSKRLALKARNKPARMVLTVRAVLFWSAANDDGAGKKVVCFLTSLIPAFSPRRRRSVSASLNIRATGLAGQSSAKPEISAGRSFSLGEKARMRAVVSTKIA
jgi:hypothetical protein